MRPASPSRIASFDMAKGLHPPLSGLQNVETNPALIQESKDKIQEGWLKVVEMRVRVGTP